MVSPIKVKVCGLTNVQDVDHVLKLGADFLGFIAYSKSPRAVSSERLSTLIERVPVGKRVVVDVEAGAERLEFYKALGFDFFQMHTGLEIDLGTVESWSNAVGADRLWLAPRLDPAAAFPEDILEFQETILMDTFSKSQVGGTGVTGDWGRFNALQRKYSKKTWILAGGLGPQNVGSAINASHAMHIDVNSGVEREPGIKDYEKMRELFRVLGRI